eukprot:Lankesteria_metandrocarpae@DN5215_c0_g1_i2.p1
MKVTEGPVDFIFLPTAKKLGGFPVYQAYNEPTCQPLNRYLYSKGGEWNFDDDTVEEKEGEKIGDVIPQFKLCPALTTIRYKNKARYAKATGALASSSKCFTALDPKALPVDGLGKCVMKVTGVESFTFLPTTEKRDGFPVFQGVDSTCLPLHRYLYRTGSNWNFDDDLVQADPGDRIGNIHPQFNLCTGASEMTFVDGQEYGKLEKILTSPCFTASKVEELTVDKTMDCVIGVTGRENFTFLPTTVNSKDGYAMYQGYDSDCQRSYRYLEHWSNPKVGAEWKFDHIALAGGTSNIGSVGHFAGCPKKKDITFIDDGVPGSIEMIESSICFKPMKADALTLNTRSECILRVAAPVEFTFLQSTMEAGGFPVYQGFDENCQPLNRYLYYNTGKWNFGDDFASTANFYVYDFGECAEKSRITSDSGSFYAAVKKIKYSPCFNPVDAEELSVDITADCLMKVTGSENFTFLPTTTKSTDGNIVYQGFDETTCHGLNRYLRHTSQYDYVDDPKAVDGKAAVGYFQPEFTGCPDTAQTYFIDGRERSKLEAIPTSRCFPKRVDSPFPLDFSRDCLLEVTGPVNFTFLPTTKQKNHYTVFQGYDATCKPLNRYLYSGKNASGKDRWMFGDDLLIGGTTGTIDPQFTQCPYLTQMYFSDGKLQGKAKKIAGSICFLLINVEELPLDKTMDCVIKVTGREELTFLPTTKKSSDGNTIYQGYDSSCQRMNRYLVHWSNAKGDVEWKYDDTIVEGKISNIGSIPDFTDCPKKTDITFIEDGVPGSIEMMESSICFKPVEDKLLPLDTHGECILKITEGLTDFSFLATANTLNGYPVYQGFGDKCQPLNRYLYHNQGEWKFDDDMVAETDDILGFINPQFT